MKNLHFPPITGTNILQKTVTVSFMMYGGGKQTATIKVADYMSTKDVLESIISQIHRADGRYLQVNESTAIRANAVISVTVKD